MYILGYDDVMEIKESSKKIQMGNTKKKNASRFFTLPHSNEMHDTLYFLIVHTYDSHEVYFLNV